MVENSSPVDVESQQGHSQPTAATSAEGPSKQYLTTGRLYGGSIRADAAKSDGTPKSWRRVTLAFEDYLMTQHAAADTWENEKAVRPQSHRFTATAAREKTGKIYGGLRYVRNNTPPSLPLRTVLLTFEGWPFDPEGRPAPPADFLQGLKDGRRAAMRNLRETLDGLADVCNYGYVTVLEPHSVGQRRCGYPHFHVGAAVVGDIDAVDLQPVVYAYTEANPFARPVDHGEGAVTVRDGKTDENAERLGAELTANLIGYAFAADREDETPLDNSTYAERRFASLLWATGTYTVTWSDQFREWFEHSQRGYELDDATDESSTPPTVPKNGGGGPERVDPKPVETEYQFPDENDEVTDA